MDVARQLIVYPQPVYTARSAAVAMCVGVECATPAIPCVGIYQLSRQPWNSGTVELSTVGSQLSEHVGTRGVWITEMYG